MAKKDVLLVCVTAQESCGRLVEYGSRLARQENAVLRIVSILPRRQGLQPDLNALERLNAAAIASGAQMRVCFSDDPAEKIREIASEFPVRMLITGFPGKNSSGFIRRLHAVLPRIPLCMVDTDGAAYSVAPHSDAGEPSGTDYACATFLLSQLPRSASNTAP
jgi:K+-sensing histidine kinase KdpD